MLLYIVRRILLMIPTLIGMTLLLFCVVRFAPGVANAGGLDRFGGMQSTEARAAQVRAVKLRLRMIDAEGRPIPFYEQYILWLKDTVTGNFGESLVYHKPVLDVIAERIPITITLSLMASVIVYLIAIPGGMLAAARRGRTFDVAFSFVTLALYSLPVIWIGSMLIGFLANPKYLAWFPPAGLHSTDTSHFTFAQMLGDYTWHLVLPLFCYVYGGFAFLSKLMRASILDNLDLDYARTAKAKGLPGHTVVLRHVFRNSLLPLITVSAGILPGLLGGSVIVESMFSIQGLGQLGFTATLGRDLPVIQALGFVGAVLTLISYLVTDLCYAFADPRVSYD